MALVSQEVRGGVRLLGAIAALAVVATIGLAGRAEAASLYASQHKAGANSVAQLHIGAGGKLEALNPTSVGADQRPLGIVASADGSVYVTNVTTDKLAQYDISASGALTAKTPFLVTVNNSIGAGLALAPGGDDLYASGSSPPFFGGVFQFDIGAGGAATLKSPPFIAQGSGPESIAVHPTLAFLYATNRLENKITKYPIGAGGSLSAGSSITPAAPKALAITPDGLRLYALGEGVVFAFGIDQTTGALTPVAGSPFALVSGNGQGLTATNVSLYVSVDDSTDRVAMFDIAALSGALTPKSPASIATGAGGTPSGIVISPDGASVYLANANGNSISQFDVGSGGVLALKIPASVAVPGEPTMLAVTTAGDGGSTPPAGPVPTPPPPTPVPPTQPSYHYVGFVRDGKVIVTGLDNSWTGPPGMTPYIVVGECPLPPPQTPTHCAGEFTVVRSDKLGVPDVDIVTAARIAFKKKAKKPTILLKGKFDIPAGGRAKVKLKPTVAGSRLLAKGGTFKVWLVTKLGNGSSPIEDQQKLRMKFPKRK